MILIRRKNMKPGWRGEYFKGTKYWDTSWVPMAEARTYVQLAAARRSFAALVKKTYGYREEEFEIEYVEVALTEVGVVS
jgi:hypothetical protein